MHIDVVKGDYIFDEGAENGWKNFKKKVHELRMQGYRYIGHEHGYLDYHEYYRKKGKKKIVIVTLMHY